MELVLSLTSALRRAFAYLDMKSPTIFAPHAPTENSKIYQATKLALNVVLILIRWRVRVSVFHVATMLSRFRALLIALVTLGTFQTMARVLLVMLVHLKASLTIPRAHIAL